MKILAIETSCDETGISIIEASGSLTKSAELDQNNHNITFTILADTLASQAKLHNEYGGVFPTLAKREHIKALPLLFEQALQNAGAQEKSLHMSDIDAIAVTHGPGLEPALWTGINFAKDLAEKWNIPIVPVNHMEGHIFSALMTEKDGSQFSITNPQYPAIALLISGGHTEIILIKDHLIYEYLGGTLDDAVGEAFDKVARMLSLGYPGGPLISKLAHDARKENNNSDIGKPLPRPMIHSKDFDFSFSGLKTAVLYKIKELHKQYEDKLPQKIIEQIAMEFEDATAEVLAKKATDALREYNAQTLIIGGGVSANGYINTRIKEKIIQELGENIVKIFIPHPGMAGDNALMIAISGYYRAMRNEYLGNIENLTAHGTLKLV